ncbi:MetQ/NlpA family ABC transporter substrate-binding protein [Bariatricus sp. SGI.154]|uniref:MetQ/NlpA family ABC transporter substrate-binding protein n=1 Tax=Bariatricus sp. SGI.154 TaxID=3420549 RepID=UPI003D019201
MKKRLLSACLCGVMAATMIVGCGGKEKEETSSGEEKKDKIIIGTSSVSVDLAESGVEALEDMGYEVELKVFDDYFLPNEALVEGSIDANFYQHKPFLDTYNEEKGTDIQMLEPKLWNFWAGIYSVKADSIDDLPDGGIVGVAEDASNIDQDLRRLQEAGIIKLTDEEKDQYDIADIVENPHNYEFIQADHIKYTNMDDYTLVIGTSNTMASFDVDPTENLLQSFVDDSLALGMCVMPENADTQWAKDIMKAYTSDKAKEYVKPATGFEAVF